jgi:hypothetical protein
LNAATLRVQDNTVTKGVAGIWLELFGNLASENKEYALYTDDIVAFREYLVVVLFGAVYSPPTAVTNTIAAAELKKVVLSPTTIIVTDNQVDSLPTAAQKYCSSALFLLVNRSVSDTQDTTVSLVISSNRMRTGPTIPRARNVEKAQSSLVPTAFLNTPEFSRCAITGNLLLSDPLDAVNRKWLGTSLIILTMTSGARRAIADGLAVTGNVLLGWSNLGNMTVANSQPPQTWVPYNSHQP